MTCITLVVRWMNVRIWVFYKPAAFIKTFPPLRYFVDGWIDFQNQRFLLQGGKDFLPVAFISHGW